MSNRRSKQLKNIFALLFSLLFCIAHGQDEQQKGKLPLKEILPQIEQALDVRFSYLDKDVEGIKILPPNTSAGLKEILKALEARTGLSFQLLNERYIAIIKDDAFDFCGILLDQKTGKPLSGATVQLGETRSAVTDAAGRFYFRGMDPETRLHIRHLGYEPVLLPSVSPVAAGDCEIIEIIPVVEKLPETVVVNYLTSGISKSADGSINIDTERFGVLPGLLEPDVLQTVEALPGVESVNETISNINIRGGTSDQNLVLFDGIKMYLTGHFFGLISAFNANLTSRATLVKNGTAPALSDGVSGTIDIQSKDEITGSFSGGLGLSLVSADAYFQVPVSEKLEFHLSGRRSINDFFNTPAYNSYLDRTFQDTEILIPQGEEGSSNRTVDFSYYDYSFKALYDLNERHKLRFTTLYINNDLDYTEFADSEAIEERRKSSLAQRNLALGGNWNARWSDGFSTEAVGYFTQYRLEAGNFAVGPNQRLLQQNEVLETGLKLNGTNTFNSSFRLRNGYHFYEVGVLNVESLNNPFFSSRIRNVIRSHSVFSELNYSGEKVFIRSGVRLNYLQKLDELLVEPRLSFNYKLDRRISFKLQGEFKSQVTSQSIDLQEDFLGVENRRWILADNETFPVIKSRQLSSGFDFRAGGWYLDLEAFYKKVQGISTSNQGFQDQNEFKKVSGDYTARGIELLVNKKMQNFHAYISYTLAHSFYNFEELEPQSFPNNFDIPHSASLAFNYTYENFKFSLGGKIRSGKPYTQPVAGEETRREGNRVVVNYSEPNSSRLPEFFRVDASSSYRFRLTDKLDVNISIGVLNVFNRENIINRYYRVSEEDPERAVEIDNTSLRFTPNALIRIGF